MTNSEHLIENMLVALERGKSYEKIISDKLNAKNATQMTMDTAWEVAQYVYYSYMPCRNDYLESNNEELQEQNAKLLEANAKLEFENERLKAELDRIAPFLATHGFPGYSIEKENNND